MEISYYNDATRNSLVVRCADPKETAGYQYRMISCNRIPGLLPCSIREIDGEAYLAYDVTGLQSLQRLYGERDLERESFKKLLYSIAEAGKTLSRYLLDFSGLVLAPELIFYDYAQERYLFLYNPGEKREESLSGLLQYAEKKIRPGQKDLQFLLYRLLDLSGNPNFILKQEVLDRVLVSPAAGGGQEEEPGRDPVSFSRRGQEQCPNQDREQPYGYRWQQEETQPEVFAQEQRKEVSPPPSPEKKIKKETRSRTAGTFLAAISLLLAAIGTELINLYLPVPEGIAVIVRSLLLGFLVAAVVIAAYGTVLSFRNGEKDGKETAGQVPPIVPAGAVVTPAAAAAPSSGTSGWQDPRGGGNWAYGSDMQEGQGASRAAGTGTAPVFCGIGGASMFSVSLSSLPCTVGSDPGMADCVLQDPSVGRIHARISRGRGGEILLTDCSSRFGTFLNGVRLMPNESMALQRGDQVRFGNLSFVFR